MRRAALLLLSSIALAACGGSTLQEAPRVSSLLACTTTRDAVRSASAAAYATTSRYPTTFTALMTASPPLLSAGSDTTITDTTIEGKGWTLTMSGGGPTPPKLICAETPLG